MGRSKKEMKRVHARRVKRDKRKLQLYSKKEIAFEKLNQHAKHLLDKSKKKKTSFA